jgi:hypothetical protein
MTNFTFIVVFLSLISAFVLGSWGIPERVSAQDRCGLVSRSVTAITGFAIASLFINWVNVPVAVWLAGVALFAVGVVGAALRWPQVPWFESTRPALRAFFVVTYCFVSGLVVGVAYV